MGCSSSKDLKARTQTSGCIATWDDSSGCVEDRNSSKRNDSDRSQAASRCCSQHGMREVDAQEKIDLRSLMHSDMISDEEWNDQVTPSLKALMQESKATQQSKPKLCFKAAERKRPKTASQDFVESETAERFDGLCSKPSPKTKKKWYSSAKFATAAINPQEVEATNRKRQQFVGYRRSISSSFQTAKSLLAGIRSLRARIHGDGSSKVSRLDREGSLGKDCDPGVGMNENATGVLSKPVLQRPEARRSGSLKGLFYGASLESPDHFGINQLQNISPTPSDLQQVDDTWTCTSSFEESSSSVEVENSASLMFNPHSVDILETALKQASVDRCFKSSISDSSSILQRHFEEGKHEHMPRALANETDQGEESVSEAFMKHLREKRQVMHAKKISSSKVSALELEEKKLRPNLFQRFEFNSPPGGAERVVLYSTSLRGIRKTYEDCKSVRMLLRGFFVEVDERDVSMHLGFKQEIQDLIGQPVNVPRLFIKGRYIGGAEEVLRLNEEGMLANLLEDLPKQRSSEPCKGCGGVRFIPCTDCSGSCKIISENNEVVQCQSCNENGLIRCPMCF
ncbi:hypothetical protein O6H91_09G050200 [Diphasiastrum complanatum]|uniref:Uncharacterized protein n=1 Tax=Diphasiastrum complanatum TaxID=34168 RepID=A0ACC2CNY5_DIPCM|nr:hypothetical protein O6H91_09G050200 [Diphasiastrum complanatum]